VKQKLNEKLLLGTICGFSLKMMSVPGTGGSLTPVILATQEAEIRRIVVLSQPQANSSQDHISKKRTTKKCW
jgi:hypothetical protein